MASGGGDREVDSRVTCSVCLEPYRGRFPKLLPCFHTFCLPCLTQMALAEATHRKGGIGDEASGGGSIACPSCRAVIPIPAGGVTDFQSNFYLFEEEDENEPPPKPVSSSGCDICDAGQTAKYFCHKCQQKYCSRCQRCHEKFCSTGVPLVQHAKQQSQRAESSPADHKWERKLNDLAQSVVVLQTANTLLTQNVTLLHDSHKKMSAEVQTMTTLNDNHKKLMQSVQKDISALRGENATLSQEILLLQKENNKLQQSLSAVQAELTNTTTEIKSLTSEGDKQKQEVQSNQKEISSLKAETASLRQDVSSLQKENSKLRQDQAALQADLSKQRTAPAFDGSQIQKDVQQLQGDNGRIAAEVRHLQTEQSRMEDQTCQIRSNHRQMEATVKKLQVTMSNLESEASKLKEMEKTRSDAALPGGTTELSPQNSNSSILRRKKGKKVNDRSEADILAEKPSDEGKEDSNCPICLELPQKPKKLLCGDTFCTDCIKRALSFKPGWCPKCQRYFEVMEGTQPQHGSMTHTVSRLISIPGYEGCGTIIIQYYIPAGTQEACHPNPGRWYNNTQRTAYLPNNKEGNEVLKMLRKAFDHRLVFTIGDSVMTGARGVITWNGIHHKTATHGGPSAHGYPDPGYLKQVKQELAAVGITSP